MCQQWKVVLVFPAGGMKGGARKILKALNLRVFGLVELAYRADDDRRR